MSKLLCKKGQGVIEALVALPLLAATIAGLALIIYKGMIYYFADYQLHESLVCVESFPASICKNEIKRRLQPVLLGGVSAHVQINKMQSHTVGKITINFKTPMLLEKKLSRNIK